MMQKTTSTGFTLIEILVVITIIGLVATVSTVSYVTAVRNGRDTRRKTDLSQVQAAMELYRSSNSVYPLEGVGTGLVQFDCNVNNGPLTDSSGRTYLSRTPEDPRCGAAGYTYDIFGTTTSDYTIGSRLESGVTNCGGNCGSGLPCNYCLGPYGQK